MVRTGRESLPRLTDNLRDTAKVPVIRVLNPTAGARPASYLSVETVVIEVSESKSDSGYP
jgi:hypothetical protein